MITIVSVIMIGMKKIILLLILLMMPFISGCKKEEVAVYEGRYLPEGYVPKTQDPNLGLILSDGNFTFINDIAKSYIPSGKYIIKNDKVLCRNEIDEVMFTFKIINQFTLQYVLEESTYKDLYTIDSDNNFAFEDGTVFVLQENQ